MTPDSSTFLNFYFPVTSCPHPCFQLSMIGLGFPNRTSANYHVSPCGAGVLNGFYNISATIPPCLTKELLDIYFPTPNYCWSYFKLFVFSTIIFWFLHALESNRSSPRQFAINDYTLTTGKPNTSMIRVLSGRVLFGCGADVPMTDMRGVGSAGAPHQNKMTCNVHLHFGNLILARTVLQ